jgi:hypothetical protein
MPKSALTLILHNNNNKIALSTTKVADRRMCQSHYSPLYLKVYLLIIFATFERLGYILGRFGPVVLSTHSQTCPTLTRSGLHRLSVAEKKACNKEPPTTTKASPEIKREFRSRKISIKD